MSKSPSSNWLNATSCVHTPAVTVTVSVTSPQSSVIVLTPVAVPETVRVLNWSCTAASSGAVIATDVSTVAASSADNTHRTTGHVGITSLVGTHHPRI
jgi:hypothetical protein